MHPNKKAEQPDNTALRTALWRALHVQTDPTPHIFEDEIGLKLIGPPDDWRQRPDMKYTSRLRASTVARARFVDDWIVDQFLQGIRQYVILGSGLDTFAQRKPEIAAQIQIFEIDQPGMLAWKRQQLVEHGFGMPPYLHFVGVDFETSSWWEPLLEAGFDANQPAIVACTGVSLYLSGEAIISTLKLVSAMHSGTTLAMTFYLPIQLLDEVDQPMQEIAEKGSREAGTPMISFFTNDEILKLADNAGLKDAQTFSTKQMEQRYFDNRTDDLRPATGEVFLLAST